MKRYSAQWIRSLIALSFIYTMMAYGEAVRIQPPTYSGSYALIISNSHYTGGWRDLPGVRQDLRALKRTLTAMGFKVEWVKDGTKNQIRDKVDDFVAQYGSTLNNRVLIFYSGHGATLQEGTTPHGFIVPSNTPLPEIDLRDFRRKAIDMSYFKSVSSRIDAKHVLFIFDSCFSGSIFSSMRGGKSLPKEITAVTDKPTRQVIAAGTDQQPVPDQSIFRLGFENGLAGAADLDRNGFITGTELGLYLRGFVARESGGKQTPQFARFQHDGVYGGDFVFRSPIEGTLQEQHSETRSPISVSSASLTSGQSFRDCEECPEMIVIPTGVLLSSAQRKEETKIQKRFALSRYEVTLGEWEQCFIAGGCVEWHSYEAPLNPRYPVHGVSFSSALNFTKWLSRETGAQYRLPREEEWEYAARAGTKTSRYWGEVIGQDQASCRGCGARGASGLMPREVGRFQPNGFSLYDMLGNVWEWVDGCAHSQQSESVYPSELSTDKRCNPSLRGGSFATQASQVTFNSRATYPSHLALPSFGFRVLREL